MTKLLRRRMVGLVVIAAIAGPLGACCLPGGGTPPAPAHCGDLNESNDTAGKATVLPLDDTLSGVLCAGEEPQDVDFVVATIGAGDVGSTLTQDISCSGPIVIHNTDAAGTDLGYPAINCSPGSPAHFESVLSSALVSYARIDFDADATQDITWTWANSLTPSNI